MSQRPYRQTTENTPVGIKEIAAALGTSIGTVDRALHSRPGINPITRSRVLQMAQAMGYKPNLAARYLKSQKQLRIAVHLPAEIAFFFDAVRQGIAQAAAPFEPSLRVDFAAYPRLGKGDVALFKQALSDGASGMIICPGVPAAMKPLIRKASRRNIPVVCVATDAPGTELLAAVSACPSTSGAVAGELLCRTVRSRGAFRPRDRQPANRGPRRQGRRLPVGGEVPGPLAGNRRRHRDARRSGNRLHPDRYASSQTERRLWNLCRHREFPACIGGYRREWTRRPDHGDCNRPFPALVPLIRSGRVLATIDQRPQTQGRLALQALYQFLLDGKRPAAAIKVAPHIVMMSNLDLLAERLAADTEQESEVRPRGT